MKGRFIVQEPYERTAQVVPEDWSLLRLCEMAAPVLWEQWSEDMEPVANTEYGSTALIRLRGTCPHCRAQAAFIEVGHFAYSEPIPKETNTRLHYAVLQCQACLDFILAVVKIREIEMGANAPSARKYRYDHYYIKHYPLGTPDDSVSEDVPKDIADDFSEALRCRWVNGYNATVEMCRRVLESSCLQLGAPVKLGTLQKMIDWVFEQGKITAPLRDMAHKVRLGGDRGAHPSTTIMGDQEADAVIEFTREYLDHVYVMPAKMAKFDFSRPKPEKEEVKSE
jgi:hypothetical protein